MPSVLTHRQCDKIGRSGDDDPCSECRHFGGPHCNCRLAESLSYTDEVWDQTILRNEGGSPIDSAHVKSDWRGETREQLLQKPDYLPAFIRQSPRAYLDDDTILFVRDNLKDDEGEKREPYVPSEDEDEDMDKEKAWVPVSAPSHDEIPQAPINSRL